MRHTNIASELFLSAERGGTSASRWSLVRNRNVVIDGRLQDFRVLHRRWELCERKQWRSQEGSDNSVVHSFYNGSMV